MAERDRAVDEDKINEIQKTFENRSSDLQRSFIILVGVGLFFFFLLLLPYYSLKLESERLSRSDWLLDDTSVVIGLLNDIINQSTSIEEQSNQFNIEHAKIKEDVETYAASLNKIHYLLNRTGIAITGAGIQRLIEQIPLNPACDPLAPISRGWVDCNLQVRNNQSAFTIKNLYSSTFSAISPIQSQLVSDAEEVEGLIGNIRKQLSAESTSANQESNSTLTLPSVQPPVDQIATDLGPTPYLSNVTNELRNLRTYSAPSTGVLEFTQALSPQTREKIIQFRTELERFRNGFEAGVSFVVDGIKRLEGRFNQFESPLGNIPLGLNEAIVWFPFFLAAGFFVFSHILQQTMIIKKELHTLMQARNDPRAIARIDRHITILSSLWIDPIIPKRKQPVQLVLFFVPFLLFIASSLLVNSIVTLDNPDIREDDPFIAANSFNLGIYNWLFIVSWGLIIAGYVRILFFRI
ncbi:MAG: hypothetical protein GEU26_08510 [Nitrososphaeraceae archaeon]|nr:hypothetical protein [Nitrososphaeraceae archaeon]